MSNLESLRANRDEIISDYLDEHEWAVSADRSGSEALVIPPPADRSRFARFLDLLNGHGIEFGLSQNAFTAENTVDVWGDRNGTRHMPSGSLIVRAAQPRRRLVHAPLDCYPHLTDTFLHAHRTCTENPRLPRGDALTP